MLISFKDIQSLPGPLGQVVDGTQNANSHRSNSLDQILDFLIGAFTCLTPPRRPAAVQLAAWFGYYNSSYI